MTHTHIPVAELLARALDPDRPLEALHQEIVDGGAAALATELRQWLRPGETVANDFDARVLDHVRENFPAPCDACAGEGHQLSAGWTGYDCVPVEVPCDECGGTGHRGVE